MRSFQFEFQYLFVYKVMFGNGILHLGISVGIHCDSFCLFLFPLLSGCETVSLQSLRPLRLCMEKHSNQFLSTRQVLGSFYSRSARRVGTDLERGMGMGMERVSVRRCCMWVCLGTIYFRVISLQRF